MSDEYLWDRSGEPDPGIERLEKTLAPLAHDGRPLELPAEAVTADVVAARPAGRWGALAWLLRPGPRTLLAAACLLVIAGLASWLATRPAAPGWQVASVEGTPRIGRRPIADRARLGEGQVLVTDGRSRARLQVGSIGQVTLDPDSRLRLVRARAQDHRLALELGVLHAVIVAPPRQFTVETPAATAVDLGCAYTLEVDADGRSIVSVEMGWVSFERDGRESFIPAGARCVTLKGHDPGTPHFEDADPRLVVALEALDAASPATPPEAALAAVLEHARAEDALTLWHLLARLEGEARGIVYERLAALAPPPAGVTRAGVLAGDRAQLDLWWNSFGLGDVEWWRLWAQSPPGRS